ncbi:MAG: energy-coupling factor transporter ATPase [Clostridia bacterium]|nr:energy-coupling factor transporter ATPase [Clostridia bacterium]
MSYISFQDVYFSYQGSADDSVRAVNGVSLDIEKGKVTAILGRNGSGKSTMAKLINGLLIPAKGKVYVDGIDTADEDRIWDIRSQVGMIFQNPDNQIVGTTVEEDVAFGPENLGVPYDELHKRVAEALEQVSMSEYAKSAPNMLSGGQKQRVSIAGILAMHTNCIVMDESTAMLDPAGRRDILDLVMSLNRDKGITVIMITHFMDEAALADKVVVVGDGVILDQGTPKEVFAHRDLALKAGLDLPPVNNILYELSKTFKDIDITALTMEEATEQVVKALAQN